MYLFVPGYDIRDGEGNGHGLPAIEFDLIIFEHLKSRHGIGIILFHGIILIYVS